MSETDKVDASVTTKANEADALSCPRCDSDISDHDFYGVCNDCASALRATYSGSPRGDVTSTEYEPKMNVTPNAVASKE